LERWFFVSGDDEDEDDDPSTPQLEELQAFLVFVGGDDEDDDDPSSPQLGELQVFQLSCHVLKTTDGCWRCGFLWVMIMMMMILPLHSLRSCKRFWFLWVMMLMILSLQELQASSDNRWQLEIWFFCG
jgi:hypothetical protein